MTSYGELKTMNRNVLLMPHLCLCLQKDFQQDVGHSSDLGQRQSGFPLTKKDQEENGVAELMMIKFGKKRTPSFPSNDSLEECSKAKEVENYLYASVPMVIRLKLFSAQFFLLMCVRNTVLDKQEQGDLLWQSKLTHCSSQPNY